MKANHQQPHSGTRVQFISWTVGFLLSCQILLGNNLLNIDFGIGATSQKQGPAAIGNSPSDFWNLSSRDIASGEVIDLVWSDGSESMVDLTLANASGAWGNGSLDPMFGVYLYPSYGENITVTLNDLPSGIYALYLYAHGALDNENGVVGVASGGIAYGPLRVGTAPGWSSPIWENERQYVLFDSVVVGADHQVVITVYPGDGGLAVLNGLQLLKQSIAPPAPLVNVDFSGHQNPAVRIKNGPAVLGYSPEDVWNIYSRDDGNGGYLESGALVNLVSADGSPTGAGLTVQNAPGLWIANHSDAMMDSYLYPHAAGEMVVTVTNLSDGRYDLYFYSHGFLDGENGNVQVRVGDMDYGVKVTTVTTDWQTLPWQEGVQYLRFQDLSVSSHLPMVITIRPGTTGLPVMNGMQLLRHSDCSPPSDLVSWWPGEGDGQDVAGGNDGELVNGLDFANGLVGQAFNFDSPGEHLVSPTLADFAADSFTLEAWINPDPSNMTEQSPILEFAEATAPAGAHIWLSVLDGAGAASEGALFGNVRSMDGENHFLGTPPGRVNGGEWSHVAMTYDSLSGIGSLYLNGNLEDSRPLGSFSPQTRQPLYIGYRPQDSPEGAAGFTFGGLIDEPSFYARALSASEIAAVHAAGSNGKCGLPAQCVSAPPDLLAWWPGQGDGEDVAGGNDGELENGLGFEEGLVGQAFHFDAPGEHLVTPTFAEFAADSFTLETWINPDPARLADQQPILEFAEATSTAGVHLWLSVVDGAGAASEGALFGNIRSMAGENYFLGTSPGSVAGGVWSHVAMTYNSSSGRGSLYLNGRLEVSADWGSFVPRTREPLYIGYRPQESADGGGGYTFGGKIDEPSFYARALSAAEIAAIHAAGSNGKCGTPAQCVSAPPNLLAWWPGEGHGEDVAGGNEGELMNGVGLGAGVVGQTLVFDGIDDHVRIPFSESLTSEAFSVEAWIRPLGPVIDPQWNQDFVFGQALGSPWVVVRPGTGGVRPVFGFFVDPFLYPEVESSVELPLDEFSHVAGTWDGTGLRIYVNGVLAGESFPSQAPVLSTCDFYIGGHLGNCAGYDFDGGYFHGAVDELSLYGRALSDSEIAAIHAAGSNGKCVPQGYTLRVGTTPGGTVLRNPELPGYQPGDTVTLTALPDVGFVFDHWEGDVSGTDPEVTLVMDGPRQVMAIFLDVAPPAIEIQSPTPGTTEHSTFILSGTVTDNLGVGSAMWEWNGQSLGFLPLNDGQFYVDGLQWALGENRIRVVAVDIAGNEASTEIVVEWAPVRLLSVLDPFPRQEGQRIQVTIQLASSGDVGGASFVLRYNPAYLKQPDLDWSQSVRSALNQVNTDIPGEVRATFALPATAVPAGTRNLAVVTFRARSVPETLTTPLLLQLLDVSDSNGNSMASGSAVRSGQATILVRRVVGDNNANHRLDVGDATLIQRLLTGIDPVRFWDRTGNDVNENTLLDSGDVIRVLRAVVGLDPQPLPSLDGVGSADISLARQSLVPMSDETAGAIALEADSLRAAPGELVTVRVRFAGVLSPVAAVALNLEYPVEALRLLNPQSHRVGEVVPATAVAIWNVAPAQNDYTLQSGTVSLAMSSALAWPSSDGVVAEFIFQVQEGQAGWHRWPIRVSQAEISADGYDMAALADATVYFVGRDPVPPQLTPASVGLGEGGFGFSFQGEFGVEYIVEVSSNLTEWVSLGTRTGTNEPITISDPAASGAEYRFYRVRFE